PRSYRPLPLADFRQILAMLKNVFFMFDEFITDALLEISGLGSELRQAINGVGEQVKPVEMVFDRHVKRGGRGSFFLVTAHVQVPVVSAPIGQPMNQPGITMKSENDRFIRGKQQI